ncbi:MAG: aldo/keto reductase [Candidatus Heimdallarchaeota archaeon]|nr:aldo/keto reductase [Candidatus Heimdallarchaeota archaeon]
MHYRKFGKTGIDVSVLGFGCMRLPTEKPGESKIDEKEAIRIIRKGIDSGINYVDSAYSYHQGESEVVLGKALKDGYREKVTLATKLPVWHKEFTEPEDFEKYLDEQLEKLDVECIDVFLLHALNEERWNEKVLKLNLFEHAKKAKEEGKIKHLGFSFHDKPEVLKKIIDSGEFEMMLVQYNILDTANEEMIHYAAEKGLGVAIMGPVGGGRLAGNPPEDMQEFLTEDRENFVDLALKFVWSNPNVSVALSGMGSEEMVDENIVLASSDQYTLTKEELQKVKTIGEKFNEKTEVICTNCKYCVPCPNEVNIPYIFRALIYYQVYGQEDYAKWMYGRLGQEKGPKGKPADGCIECGECEPKCPQEIPIIKQLKEAHEILSQE